jgi:uncharacterized repeat protein (TIGR01451 family)
MKTRSRVPYERAAAAPARPRTSRLSQAVVLSFALLVPFAAARAAEGVVSQLSALKQAVRTDPDGRPVQEYVPFSKVVPGDVLLCTVEYTNKGDAAAGHVIVTLPVPPEMSLVAGSEAHETAEALYSVDGGQTYGPLSTLSVQEPDGTSRPARFSDVNAVRWTLIDDLAPGTSGKLSYLATIK